MHFILPGGGVKSCVKLQHYDDQCDRHGGRVGVRASEQEGESLEYHQEEQVQRLQATKTNSRPRQAIGVTTESSTVADGTSGKLTAR